MLRSVRFTLVLLGTTCGDKAADEVLSLPGWDGALPSRHYSGYLPADNGAKMIHYYLQEADTDASSKPLLYWSNGGPGASSIIGSLTELGQLVFNRDSLPAAATRPDGVPALYQNPYSWTTLANVLIFETPAGVGYSYCVDESSPCVNNDTSTASDNHDALAGFLARFPEYRSRSKYLTGESYAGIYLPMLLDEILKQGVITGVAGLAIGNGCWGTVGGTNCGDLLNEPGTVYKVPGVEGGVGMVLCAGMHEF